MNMRTFNRRYLLQVVMLVAVAVLLVATTPNFQGESAVYASLERATLIGILAAGVAVTMIAGELDMSIASMAVFSGVVAILLGDAIGLVPAILIATVIGILLGALQGWIIGKTGINSLVFTVGTLILLRGLAWLLASGAPVTLSNFRATDPLLQRWVIFSPSSIILIVLVIGLGIFLAKTRWGRQIYAIGGARQESIAAGVSVPRSMILAFAISGGAGALAGALTSMRGASVTPDSFSTILLTAVACALIGGLSLYGGRGDMVNVTLGVAIIAVLSAGLAAKGWQSYVTELITGALLLAVIITEYFLRRVGERRRLDGMRRSVIEHA